MTNVIVSKIILGFAFSILCFSAGKEWGSLNKYGERTKCYNLQANIIKAMRIITKKYWKMLSPDKNLYYSQKFVEYTIEIDKAIFKLMNEYAEWDKKNE